MRRDAPSPYNPFHSISSVIVASFSETLGRTCAKSEDASISLCVGGGDYSRTCIHWESEHKYAAEIEPLRFLIFWMNSNIVLSLAAHPCYKRRLNKIQDTTVSFNVVRSMMSKSI